MHNDPSFIRKGALLDPNGRTYGALHFNTGHLYAVKTVKNIKFIKKNTRIILFKQLFSTRKKNSLKDLLLIKL